MRIFLIDFENVHSEGMSGVDSLTDNDEVVIFYSVNADTVSFELLHKLMFCKAKLSYFKIRRGGRNALDFQLSTYLGYLISTKPNADFYLISKDNGFDFVLDFWESGCINIKPSIKRYVNVKTMLTVASASAKKTEHTEPLHSEESARSEELIKPEGQAQSEEPAQAEEPIKPVRKTRSPRRAKPIETVEPTVREVTDDAVAVVSDEDEEAVTQLLSDSKSSHELYIGTVKKFGQKKGVEIYRNIKSRFFSQKTG